MLRNLLSLALSLSCLEPASAQEKFVIQYDCVPNYANWGGVTALYRKETGVRVPPDMKGSFASTVAIEQEQVNPQADCVYYSGAIGFQAATKGLHQPFTEPLRTGFWTFGTGSLPAGERDHRAVASSSPA